MVCEDWERKLKLNREQARKKCSNLSIENHPKKRIWKLDVLYTQRIKYKSDEDVVNMRSMKKIQRASYMDQERQAFDFIG